MFILKRNRLKGITIHAFYMQYLTLTTSTENGLHWGNVLQTSNWTLIYAISEGRKINVTQKTSVAIILFFGGESSTMHYYFNLHSINNITNSVTLENLESNQCKLRGWAWLSTWLPPLHWSRSPRDFPFMKNSNWLTSGTNKPLNPKP